MHVKKNANAVIGFLKYAAAKPKSKTPPDVYELIYI